MAFIYGLVCPIEHRIRYIGQTRHNINERLRSHIREAQYERKRYTRKQNWIRKVHKPGMSEITIIVLEEIEDNSLLNDRECFWIDNITNLTNATKGGTSGYIFTTEYRKHMSEIKQGDKNPMFGKPSYIRTDDFKQKLSAAIKGSVKFQKSRKSLDYRKKISDIQSINTWLLIDENMNICAKFRNAREMADYIGCSTSNIKNARRDMRPIGKGKSNWYYISYEIDFEIFKEKISKHISQNGPPRLGPHPKSLLTYSE